MSDAKKEWHEIQIRYDNGEGYTLYRDDLEKIAAIGDVIDALDSAKSLVASLQGILGD